MFTKEAEVLTKPYYEAIKKISKGKWKWKPKPRDYFLNPTGTICIIAKNGETTDYSWYNNHIMQHNLTFHNPKKIKLEDCIPLLPWERIEKVIKQAGYDEELYDMTEEDGEYIYVIWLGDCSEENATSFEGRGKSRQLAVMRAVIKLAKEAI